MKIVKLGEIIKPSDIPPGIENNNINGPVVFKRPKFFPSGSKWIMYFAHHFGKGIRVAESDFLYKGWKVKNKTIINLKDVPGTGHVASPEVKVHNNRLDIFYHCIFNNKQITFRAYTFDGLNWNFDKQEYGYFYFRIVENDYAISKYNNKGGVWYKKVDGKFILMGTLLPNMRHCCYFNGKIYWSEIGECPEIIYRASILFKDFSIKNKEVFLTPTKDYEKARNTISKPGPNTGVTELRDPYVVQNGKFNYIFYTVRGEESIALAKFSEKIKHI